MPKKQTILTFRRLRIFILLVLLVAVAGGTYIQRNLTANWLRPLSVTIYPINGDGKKETRAFINSLGAGEYASIGQFFREEAEAFSLQYAPTIYFNIGPEISGLPPLPPRYSEGRFAIARWSLGLRKWVYDKTDSFGLDARHVRIFVIYQQAQENQALAHSFGLQKGLIGVVHAFATEQQKDQNKVIIAHELLHTLGATDKYEANGMPRYPDGFAEPEKQPLYPQEFAEIMAGRYAVSEEEAQIPMSLDQSVIGPATAREINW